MAKRGPSLYELITEREPARPPAGGQPADRDAPARRGDRARDTRPTPASAPGADRDTEHKPFPRSEDPSRTPAAQRTTAAAQDHESPLSAMLAPGRVIRVPVGYIWFAVAAFIGVAVASYAIGHQAASAAAKAEARELAGLNAPDPNTTGLAAPGNRNNADEPAPYDPLADRTNRATRNEAPNRSAARPSNQNATRASDRPASNNQTAPAASDPYGTGSGAPNVYFVGGGIEDPREPGLNYLVLATAIPQEEAERIALFFGARGLPMVRLEPNRAGRCTVTTLEGITGEQYRGNDPVRRDLEAAVTSLGRAFEAQGGYTDFADAYWAKSE